MQFFNAKLTNNLIVKITKITEQKKRLYETIGWV
jgi:hypothetical protein